MALTEADIRDIYSRILSHMEATGHFELVVGHEPKSAPPSSGVYGAVWGDSLGPLVGGSGVNSTSAYLVLNARVYASEMAVSRAQADEYDPKLLAAVSAVIGRLAEDFTLDGTVRAVDLRGIGGQRVASRGGYIEQDRTYCRLFVITVPIIINDAWPEVP